MSSIQCPVCRSAGWRGAGGCWLELAVTDSVITTLHSADSVTPNHPARGGGGYLCLWSLQICHCYNQPIVNIILSSSCVQDQKIVMRVTHCRGAGLVCVDTLLTPCSGPSAAATRVICGVCSGCSSLQQPGQTNISCSMQQTACCSAAVTQASSTFITSKEASHLSLAEAAAL